VTHVPDPVGTNVIVSVALTEPMTRAGERGAAG
jgi:hypothetical protein